MMSGSKAIVTEPAENYYDSTLDILQRKILIKVKLSNMKMSHNILLNFLYALTVFFHIFLTPYAKISHMDYGRTSMRYGMRVWFTIYVISRKKSIAYNGKIC